jgi:hypothetical protein
LRRLSTNWTRDFGDKTLPWGSHHQSTINNIGLTLFFYKAAEHYVIDIYVYSLTKSAQ